MTSEVICSADPDRGLETDQDRINRLYNKDLLKRQVERELKQEDVYKECTF